MSTSIQSQRGTHSLSWRRLSIPLVASALTLVVGCGGGGGAAPVDDGGNNPETPEPPAAPTLSSINPAQGPPAGGTHVVITGTGFLEEVTGVTTVTFGGLAAADVVVVDDTRITAVTPAGVHDTFVAVRVENSRGIAALSTGFRYLATAGIISDLNSDGYPDVVVSAPGDEAAGDDSGTVYVFYGTESSGQLGDSQAGEADVSVSGAAGDSLGTVIATGDVNGDGHDDLLVGAPFADLPSEDAGVVGIFFGPLPESAQMDLSEADVILSGEGIEPGIFGDVADHFGSALDLGDVDGDGLLDILVGAPGADAKPGEYDPLRDAGRAYLFFGSDALSDTPATGAAVTIVGVKHSRNLGSAVGIVDVNADGFGDLAISEAATWSSHSFGGHVYVFFAGDLESGPGTDADLRIVAEANGAMFGASITGGDFNADGIDDLMVGAPEANITGYSNGCVYVFLGRSDFDVESASLADVALSGYFSNTSFGSNIACADMNGDGFGDVMVGAPRYSSGASRNGRLFVFFGAADPIDDLADLCDVIYTGELADNGGFGTSVEVLDCDGDGTADVMSSATGIDSSAGRVYLFRGKEDVLDGSAAADDRTLSGDNEGDKFGSAISRGK